MKNIVIGGLIVLTSILAPQIVQAQGTMTYLSNLDQTFTGSLAVGSDSWLAAEFETGTNSSGYSLDSIQLEMTDATGNPSGFSVMLYRSAAGVPSPATPGISLGTLVGSLNPVAGGIFTYSPASNLTLSPQRYYFIVLTAGTAVADGAYQWSDVGANSYNPSGGWAYNGSLASSIGSILSWNLISGDHVQFSINATPIPEPGVLGLLGLSTLCFLWHRRKAKAV
jgi:hypothetical protein